MRLLPTVYPNILLLGSRHITLDWAVLIVSVSSHYSAQKICQLTITTLDLAWESQTMQICVDEFCSV